MWKPLKKTNSEYLEEFRKLSYFFTRVPNVSVGVFRPNHQKISWYTLCRKTSFRHFINSTCCVLRSAVVLGFGFGLCYLMCSIRLLWGARVRGVLCFSEWGSIVFLCSPCLCVFYFYTELELDVLYQLQWHYLSDSRGLGYLTYSVSIL